MEDKIIVAIIEDAVIEAEQILKSLADDNKGKIFSSVWLGIQGTGLQFLLPVSTRKVFYELYMSLILYNDELIYYENYSMRSDAEEKITEHFRNASLIAKVKLQEAATSFLEYHRKLDVKGET